MTLILERNLFRMKEIIYYLFPVLSPGMSVLLCPRLRIRETTKGANTDANTRVYLQARAWVQVYPTQQSRDLDPKTKKLSNFIGASGQWDAQKVAQSCWSAEPDFRLGCVLVFD